MAGRRCRSALGPFRCTHPTGLCGGAGDRRAVPSKQEVHYDRNWRVRWSDQDASSYRGRVFSQTAISIAVLGRPLTVKESKKLAGVRGKKLRKTLLAFLRFQKARAEETS